MIILVDRDGREVNPAPYLERLIVPASKQDEIRRWVAASETELHNCNSRNKFEKKVDEFLLRATYVQNLLDAPYSLSKETEATLGKVVEYQHISAHHPEEVNRQMYWLEKLGRIGIPLHLSVADREVIIETENRYCCSGQPLDALKAIKMLSRHAPLQLPDARPQQKKYLQSFLTHQTPLLTDWLGCSALRAGFSLPPCSAEDIEYAFRGWVEQQEPEFDTIIVLGYRIFDKLIIKKLRDNSDFTLGVYVAGVHHLKRLLGDGR